MANTPKRRQITQLPAVLQTETLKNFFGTTVDNLFQPGSSEAISGYIGQKPSYYNPEKDFYLAEPTPQRQSYQLEPAMVSTNTGGIMTDSLTYDDLVNYLQSQGGDISNHNRLFEGDYYSWAPPVDLDKLNNYVQYIWMGSLSDEDQANTSLTLRAPREVFSYDANSFVGYTTVLYTLPPVVPAFEGRDEIPVVLVNGQIVSHQYNDQNATVVISTAGLEEGDVIETMRYGDMKAVLEGEDTVAYAPFLTWSATTTGIDPFSGEYVLDLPRTFKAGELAYAEGAVYICIQDHTASAHFTDPNEIINWQLATNADEATTGQRVRLIDGIGTTFDTARSYFVDGVGESILLTEDFTDHVGGSEPRYVVIDRRSREQSPWARRNLWVHKSSLEWSGADLEERRAKRPIIEFLPNIELYNYGTTRLDDVQAMLSNATADVIDAFDTAPFNDHVWDSEKIALSRVNGQIFERLGDKIVGSVVVDKGYILNPNDRLFVHQPVTTEPALNNLVYRVVSNPDTELPSGATADVIELVLEGNPQRGDIFRLTTPGASVFADPVEYWFNGAEWLVAQTGDDVPLFMLYDSSENQLSDEGAFPETDFAGNRLFGYKIGTGPNDSVLGFPMTLNSYAQPIFQIDSVTERVTYANGEIIGYYYHRIYSDDGTSSRFSNNWFPVAAPSSQDLVDGVYTIPLNLQANPENLEVEEISRNQWFDHFSTIMLNQVGFEGHPYSVNNWRDTAKVLGTGDKILQHRAPLLKTMLIASNTNYDLPASLRYAEQEYSRYRNKFVQTITEFHRNGTMPTTVTNSVVEVVDPDAWVSAAIDHLRLNKTSDFPFAGSTMGGAGSFIPPTPAHMGLGLVAQPTTFVDESFSTPVLMIIGHDATSTPAFNDWRDDVMLAFERRIYQNIPQQFRTEARPLFDLDHYITGKFGTKTDFTFSMQEIDQMLAPYFQRWSQLNRLDFRTNNGYVADAPFTWNYAQSSDRYGNPVPGNWRGIYRLYFDTERPHTHPWEMLGFAEKPVWWQSEYGPAPYTRGNTKLWDDLRDGVIRGGPRAGTDPRYARTDLLLILPVDDEGRLLDPIAAGIILEEPTYRQATAPWKIGDVSPVESLWRQSSSYRFAQAQVGFLIKPPRFVEQGWDTINYVQDDTGQWVYSLTGNRPLNGDIYVHGEILSDGSRMVAQGVQQWISDYMVARGQSPSILGSAIRGLAVRLAHKMAGFTTSDNLRILADNFGLLPSEDIDIQLYKSPSIREEVYSGVLVEWTGAGWRVVGYDPRYATFKIINPLTTGPRGIISLATSPEPVVNAWRPNTYYPVNVNASYKNTIYRSIKGHTSSSKFDQQYWEVLSDLPTQAPRVTTYSMGDGTISEVPYGTIFTDYQGMADFLLGYQRYLEAHGWVFDQVDPNTQETIDWSLATREFLAWAQVNWQPGNFITLSPGAEGLKFQSDHGMVMDVLDAVSGVYGMMDRSGAPIHRENVVVNRLDGLTTLLSKNYDVYGARVNLGEIEHVLIFSNTTIFNDIIYAPLFNLRQPRLRVIGRRSTDWTGRLEAPGYMLIDNQIKSNFEKSATDILTMWDIEKADNATLRDHARHVTGYDSRDYLANLVLSETEQFEFYQGMIHQKGAPGAFDKLLRSDFIEQSRDLKFFEEWAIKIAEYGALDARQRIAFLFGHSTIKRDPQYVEFRVLDANSPVYPENPDMIDVTDSTVTGVDAKWIERPVDPLHSFPQRSTIEVLDTDLPAAGYVRLNEINYTVFSSDDIPTAYDANTTAHLYLGETLWVHKNSDQRDVSPVNTTTSWYVLGQYLGFGHWDAVSNSFTRTTELANSIADNTANTGVINDEISNAYATGAVIVNDQNERVFRSQKFDAPYISDALEFKPLVGETYKVSFKVRKISRETNGVKSFVRPAFDAFRYASVTDTSNVVIAPALGTKEGFGYDKDADLIDTSNWVLGEWYTVTSEWTCPISSPQYFSARSRLRVNRTYPGDTVTTAYSDAVFEVQSQSLSLTQYPQWDVLKCYHLSEDGNSNIVANVVTNAEDIDVANTVTRVYTVRPHGLTTMDRGLWVVIDGDTFSDPNLQGVSRIWDVGDGWFELLTTGELGYDFVAKGQDGPEVRILRSIHFSTMDQFTNYKNNRIGVKDEDIVYVDGNNGEPWRVYKRTSITELTDDYADGAPQPNGQVFVPDDNNRRPITYTFWNVVRSQPNRMDAGKIASSLIYDLKTKITDTDLRPEPLSLNHLTVVSPLVGIIPGRAKAEIDYILDYDPAKYNTQATGSVIGGELIFATSGNDTGLWGPNQVGNVWWDLSTVRFLETETDNVNFGLSNRDRYNVETAYRVAHWGQIAPATSVDVYEWVRSNLTPEDYQARIDGDATGTFTGQVYNLDSPSWVEAEEYDPSTGKVATFYYFWVKNLVTIPPNMGRKMSVATIARFITSPMIEDQPWIAPIMPNGVLVGGITPYLDDTFEQDANAVAVSGTVLQIETNDNYDGVIHDEWFLLRPEDERSLPPQWLWEKLRDSLVGFDGNKISMPAPLALPSALPTVNKAPVWYENPDKDAKPINPNLQ